MHPTNHPRASPAPMPMLAAISTRRLGRISCKSLEPLLRTHRSPQWVSTLHLCTRVSIFFLLLRRRRAVPLSVEDCGSERDKSVGHVMIRVLAVPRGVVTQATPHDLGCDCHRDPLGLACLSVPRRRVPRGGAYPAALREVNNPHPANNLGIPQFRSDWDWLSPRYRRWSSRPCHGRPCHCRTCCCPG